MWKCKCGQECDDHYAHCPHCGKSKDKIEFGDMLKEVFLSKNEDAVLWAISQICPIYVSVKMALNNYLSLDMPSSFVVGICCAYIVLIIKDAYTLRKKEIKLTTATILSSLLTPSIYLYKRAKATEGNVAPAFARIGFDVFWMFTLATFVVVRTIATLNINF